MNPQFQRQSDDPNDHPIGHGGYCCTSCIEDSNEGYGDLPADTCCCLDERLQDQRAAEYAGWLLRVASEGPS